MSNDDRHPYPNHPPSSTSRQSPSYFQPATNGDTYGGYPAGSWQASGYPPLAEVTPTSLHDGNKNGQSTTTVTPSSSSTTSAPAKRKRRGDVDKGRLQTVDNDSDRDELDSTPPERQTPQQRAAAAAAAAELKKRTKTQRACDSCRSRKIRCDVIMDSEPPLCHHCKQYGFECTFFLPITETRFKKKKTNAEEKQKQDQTQLHRHSPPQKPQDARVYGPTSAMHLLHSTSTIPSRVYESYDQRWHTTWEVQTSGDGLIKVQEPKGDEQPPTAPKPVDLKLERDVVETLLNAYFTEVAPIFPIVTRAEFLSQPKSPPILLYSMCLVTAARREVPQAMFDSIRHTVNSLIRSEDVLTTASIINVQALLILSMMGDCHSSFVPDALSAMWIRLGCAIRMAQDLGLHRAESLQQNIEQRRRLWAACLISDRWLALAYGNPTMIDIHDCDVRLPSCGDPNDMYLDEMVRISVILGRVLKTIYTPSGLASTNDRELNLLWSDIKSWKTNLPEHLQFVGTESPREAGLLHMLFTTVCMIFWRVFMRITYACPAHIKFSLTVEIWSEVHRQSAEAINWLDHNERMYDVWMVIAYSAVSAALVQYHTWARRKDESAAINLRTLRDTVRRWEVSSAPEHMSTRRKTSEIISLLYEATQGPPPAFEVPVLNPTGGVRGKLPPRITYKEDPARPGGGVFIADPDQPNDYEKLPGVIEELNVTPTGSDGERSMSTRPRDFVREALSSTEVLDLQDPNGYPSNLNPTMNMLEQPMYDNMNIQVMNMLNASQPYPNLEQAAQMDNGFLEGIPGAMFDWGQWDNFFSRFTPMQ